ncbi:cytochrome b5-like heme/steroid binding domain-containing protein [Kockiozyma suomiensis]|uniref:cytochrome b5-like heme/steroid binding domain-containing protein n=1 Tax=Kockiozyma suomiensis TaxID=1337062 RepID=UPI0033436728
MSVSTVLSLEDIKSHNTNESLYFVIHGKVYDATKFIDEHPGGEEVLLDCGGADATEAFEDVGHSDQARDMLPELLIGELDPEEVKEFGKSTFTASSSKPSSGSSINFVTLAGFAIMAVAGYIAYLQTVKKPE